MTIDTIGASTGNGSLATPGGGEPMLLLFARYPGRESIQRRAHEDEAAAIDALDILAQAEEAGALDPVG